MQERVEQPVQPPAGGTEPPAVQPGATAVADKLLEVHLPPPMTRAIGSVSGQAPDPYSTGIPDIYDPDVPGRGIRDNSGDEHGIFSRPSDMFEVLSYGLPEGIDPGKLPGGGLGPDREDNLQNRTPDRGVQNDPVTEWSDDTWTKAIGWGSDSGDPLSSGSYSSTVDGDVGSEVDDDFDSGTDYTESDSPEDGDGDADADVEDPGFEDLVHTDGSMDFTNDPEPEGDDPAELEGLRTSEAMRGGAGSAAAGTAGRKQPGTSSGGSTPNDWLPGETASERMRRLREQGVDPEDGDPAELEANRAAAAALAEAAASGDASSPRPDDPDPPPIGPEYSQSSGPATSTNSSGSSGSSSSVSGDSRASPRPDDPDPPTGPEF